MWYRDAIKQNKPIITGSKFVVKFYVLLIFGSFFDGTDIQIRLEVPQI